MMKSSLKTLALTGLLSISCVAMANDMPAQTQSGKTAEVAVSMITQANVAPKIQLELGAPSEVIFTQGKTMLIDKQYPAGTSTIDTSGFPAGHYQIIVTIKQQGASFQMMQNVIIAKSNANS
ncbi:MAG: hypothetical protein NTV32_06815 [Gammaproteobacteria bacterium]|nr:hypothetical protein [Gammaproteobacteria bacterium]